MTSISVRECSKTQKSTAFLERLSFETSWHFLFVKQVINLFRSPIRVQIKVLCKLLVTVSSLFRMEAEGKLDSIYCAWKRPWRLENGGSRISGEKSKAIPFLPLNLATKNAMFESRTNKIRFLFAAQWSQRFSKISKSWTPVSASWISELWLYLACGKVHTSESVSSTPVIKQMKCRFYIDDPPIHSVSLPPKNYFHTTRDNHIPIKTN